MLGVPPPGSFLKLIEPMAERNLRTSLAGLGLDRRVYFKGEDGMSRKIPSVCSLTLHSHLKSWKRPVPKVQITQHPERVKKLCHLVDIFENCNLETNASVQFSRSVVSDSLRPHESQHARPPCPSPAPGVHSDSRPSSQ